MNTKRHIAAFLAVLLAVCMMIPAVPAQMATVRLGKSKLTLKVGDTYTLKLSGVAKKNRSKIKWSSADKRIVAVKAASSNISAKLTAKKVGKTTIKAKFAGKSYACKVVVKKATGESEQIPGSLSHDGYKLKQVIVLSRHNIRSPLSSLGSSLAGITPYQWFPWSSDPSELSLRGGVLETENGQYFRQWMESEGLIPKNYHPSDEEVAVYANSKQRTIATAQYFVAGLLPTANKRIEYKVDFDTMDPVFTPQFTYMTEEYKNACLAQIHERFDSAVAGLKDNYKLVSDVIALKDSPAYKDGTVTDFVTDDTEYILENNQEPAVKGSLKTACSASDALVLQYYEEHDKKKAAFGRDLTFDQWREIAGIKDVYVDVLYTAPLVAVNLANPLLMEIRNEIDKPGRKFTFLCGHDSNLSSVHAALEADVYSLPCAIETRTPIGSKLVFSRYEDAAGKEAWSLDLVYQTTEQLRNTPILTLADHPAIYQIPLSGLTRNSSGLYEGDMLKGRIDKAIAEFDRIKQLYPEAKAA